MRYVAFILVLATSTAFAEDKPPTIYDETSNATTAFTINPYPDLIIICGMGKVVVSTKTGHVEFKDGCNPDDAARSFWRAVEQMGIRK